VKFARHFANRSAPQLGAPRHKPPPPAKRPGFRQNPRPSSMKVEAGLRHRDGQSLLHDAANYTLNQVPNP